MNKQAKIVPEKVNFPPFSHYALIKGEVIEVLRSHWKGNLATGKFSMDAGRHTDKLGAICMDMVNNFARKPNFSGYSYIDDMTSSALVHLVKNVLKFNESVNDNPFAYSTTIIKNEFLQFLEKEKRQSKIKNEVLLWNADDSIFLNSHIRGYHGED